MAKQLWVTNDGHQFATQEEAEMWEGMARIREILNEYLRDEDLVYSLSTDKRISIILLEK